MAASMQKQFLASSSVKTIVSWNIFKAGTSLLLLLLPFYLNSFMNLIDDCVISIQIHILFILLVEILSVFIVPSTDSKKVFHVSKISEYIKSLSFIVCSWIYYYFIAVIFGAPFTIQIQETVLFSALLTVTSSLPCCLQLGSDWIHMFPFQSSETGLSSVCQITCISSILGAWLGAFPIPLDWERPWQVWPISCVIGNLLGYISGLILSSIYLLYKYQQYHKYKFI